MEKSCEVSLTVKNEKNESASNGNKKVDKAPIIKEGEIILKVLVPSMAASVIMGRHGQSIKHLQRDTKASITFNKENDFYPGTTERACLIVGSVLNVRAAHDYVVDKMSDVSGSSGKISVKLLVPNSTVGMVIGKNGEYIKRIKESTKTYIQVSQKSEDRSLLERCITIAGDFSSVKQAVDFVIDKIAADPNSASCPSINYSQATTALPSVRPTGSPYAARVGAPVTSDGYTSMTGLSKEANLAVNSLYLHTHNIASHPTLDQLKAELRLNGFSDQSAGDVLAAVYTLASYGLLKLHLNSDGQSVEYGVTEEEEVGAEEPSGYMKTVGLEARKRLHGWNNVTDRGGKRVCRETVEDITWSTSKVRSKTFRGGTGLQKGAKAWSEDYGINVSYPPSGAGGMWQGYHGSGLETMAVVASNENTMTANGSGQNYYGGPGWADNTASGNTSSGNHCYTNNSTVQQDYTNSSQVNTGHTAPLNYWPPAGNSGYYGYSGPFPPPPPPNCPQTVPPFPQPVPFMAATASTQYMGPGYPAQYS